MNLIPPEAPELPYGRFFLPGPSEVHPDVLRAQTRPMISHRGAEIKELMQELQTGLEEVFLTQRPVFISTSSATGFMEAAVRNAGRTRVLSLVNGAFSQRFAERVIAASLNRAFQQFEHRQALLIYLIEETFQLGRGARAEQRSATRSVEHWSHDARRL